MFRRLDQSVRQQPGPGQVRRSGADGEPLVVPQRMPFDAGALRRRTMSFRTSRFDHWACFSNVIRSNR